MRIRTVGNCYTRRIGIRCIRGKQMVVTCHIISSIGIYFEEEVARLEAILLVARASEEPESTSRKK